MITPITPKPNTTQPAPLKKCLSLPLGIAALIYHQISLAYTTSLNFIPQTLDTMINDVTENDAYHSDILNTDILNPKELGHADNLASIPQYSNLRQSNELSAEHTASQHTSNPDLISQSITVTYEQINNDTSHEHTAGSTIDIPIVYLGLVAMGTTGILWGTETSKKHSHSSVHDTQIHTGPPLIETEDPAPGVPGPPMGVEEPLSLAEALESLDKETGNAYKNMIITTSEAPPQGMLHSDPSTFFSDIMGDLWSNPEQLSSHYWNWGHAIHSGDHAPSAVTSETPVTTNNIELKWQSRCADSDDIYCYEYVWDLDVTYAISKIIQELNSPLLYSYPGQQPNSSLYSKSDSSEVFFLQDNADFTLSITPEKTTCYFCPPGTSGCGDGAQCSTTEELNVSPDHYFTTTTNWPSDKTIEDNVNLPAGISMYTFAASLYDILNSSNDVLTDVGNGLTDITKSISQLPILNTTAKTIHDSHIGAQNNKNKIETLYESTHQPSISSNKTHVEQNKSDLQPNSSQYSWQQIDINQKILESMVNHINSTVAPTADPQSSIDSTNLAKAFSTMTDNTNKVGLENDNIDSTIENINQALIYYSDSIMSQGSIDDHAVNTEKLDSFILGIDLTKNDLCSFIKKFNEYFTSDNNTNCQDGISANAWDLYEEHMG